MNFRFLTIIASVFAASVCHAGMDRFVLDQAAAAQAPPSSKETVACAPLPQAVSSFGAAAADGWVYIYGGHQARTHSYSMASVHGKLHRLKLSDPKFWEELPSDVAVQGLALVAHNGKIYRIGGMQPRNQPGQPVDNHSIASCACFDPLTKKWQALPDMPLPRSSHDAVVVGDKIIVAGGWDMKGAGMKTDFHDSALILDLSKQPLKWVSVPQPLQRRALTAAVLDGKVYVAGGMDARDKAQLTVDIYDPIANTWTTGPNLPGPRLNGFSPAGVDLGNRLYVSTGDGKVWRLSIKGDAWEEIANLKQKRIVHRMVPASSNMLLVLGGAMDGDNIALNEFVTVGPAAPVQGSSDIGKDLKGTLRSLEKEIAAVRGLAFKTPVQAKIIARPDQGSRGVQGYYSTKEKSLFLYEDVKGSYQKGVLIHEMVHALQDQHFDLARLKTQLHQDNYSSDAELALAALIEGDATYTMIEVLQKENPKVAAMLNVPLAQAKNLQNAFLYAQGARYVKALKDRGGWATVNASYKFPPRNTATIFNLNVVLAIDLGPGKIQGAYNLLKTLQAHPDTRDQAEPAARAWRGDRTQKQEAGQMTVMACATRESAVLVQTALSKLKETQGNFRVHQKDQAGTTWIAHDKSVHGIMIRGQRVWTLVADNEANFKILVDQLDGPPRLTVFAAKDKRHITLAEMTQRLLEADLICIGEAHNAELHHRVQLEVIKALFAQDKRLGVGMEMFQRPFQKEIDRYLAGQSNEDEFLKASEYKQRWGFDWSLYKPIADFCRDNKVALAGLNAPKELTSRISKVAFAGLSDDEKKQLGPIDFHLKEHREYWYERVAKLHGETKTTEEQKERSYQVMAIWDDFMAASAAQFQQERSLRRLVVLAGSGHVDHGFGIPLRAGKRTGGKVATIRIEYEGDAESTVGRPVTDYVVIVR